jgi:hypothetical protein
VAEFRRISQHDRGLMADGVISVMGVAMMMAAIAVKMVVMVVGVAFIVAMDMRMVTSAMAMIECAHVRPKTPSLPISGSKTARSSRDIQNQRAEVPSQLTSIILHPVAQ